MLLAAKPGEYSVAFVTGENHRYGCSVQWIPYDWRMYDSLLLCTGSTKKRSRDENLMLMSQGSRIKPLAYRRALCC